MRLKELKEKVEFLILDMKDNGHFPKENNLLDYKLKLSLDVDKTSIENFCANFMKDITAFSNGDGGIIFLGFDEDKDTGQITDSGLETESITVLEQTDLNLVTQKFDKIMKIGVSVDLQLFRISSRQFFYLLIEKSATILVPQIDYLEYKLGKGEIYYRASGKNELANKTSVDFNRFLQTKANEKNKEFMDIWSKLLPEMFDINPREVLILNPKTNKVYGYNSRDNQLAESEIDIDQGENGVLNIILNAISAGDIGKISNDEGKPIYKIIGEIKSKSQREFIYFSNLLTKVKAEVMYNVTSTQLKCFFKYLNWIDDAQLPIENPDVSKVNSKYNNLIWIETLDTTQKIVFSYDAIPLLQDVINNIDNHLTIFGKSLLLKKKSGLQNIS
jgi:hypothetical protein